MKMCECGNAIPNSKTINGKRRNLQNRTKCLNCLPFGESRYKPKTIIEKRTSGAKKSLNHYHNYKKKHGVDPIKIHREARKVELVELFGGGCQICGYRKCMRNLAFHHLKDKKFALSSRAFQFSWDKIITEARKCVLVCHNCHGEIHDGLITNEETEKLGSDRVELSSGPYKEPVLTVKL